MRILVAGGTGHTGERLARRLLLGGHDVRLLTRQSREHPIVAPLLKIGVGYAHGDLTQVESAITALQGCDLLASCAHIRHANGCIDACARAGVRGYLQMSSTRRYTRWPCVTSREVIDGEDAITASGLEYTIIRPTMIFGGRRDANITRMVDWFRKHNWFPVFGSGKNLLQPIFVEDLVDVMVAAINDRTTASGKDYTVAGPEPMEYRDFLRETALACGRERVLLPRVPLGMALAAASVAPPFLTRRGLNAEQIRRFGEDKNADISRARQELQFSPRPYREAIQLKASGRAEVEIVYPE